MRPNVLFRAVQHATLPFRRALLRRRLGRLVCEEVEGLAVVVLPDVFNPAVFGSSDVLVRALRQATPTGQAEPGRLLDMGTGTGVCAVAAAKLGYAVTAVDMNPAAVRCVRINALVHHVEERIDVRHGDLFAPVERERFDLVLFNPPFFSGPPRSSLERAWRSEDVPERFGAGLPAVLAPGGRALVVVSSHGGRERTERALVAAGLTLSTTLEADLGYEVVTIIEARREVAP